MAFSIAAPSKGATRNPTSKAPPKFSTWIKYGRKTSPSHSLPETSNVYRHPGIAGGSPLWFSEIISVSQSWRYGNNKKSEFRPGYWLKRESHTRRHSLQVAEFGSHADQFPFFPLDIDFQQPAISNEIHCLKSFTYQSIEVFRPSWTSS